MGCVERACEQIRCSERLAHVLSRVLAAGNALNADTHRGGALAIKIDSLAKMSDVKVCRQSSQNPCVCVPLVHCSCIPPAKADIKEGSLLLVACLENGSRCCERLEEKDGTPKGQGVICSHRGFADSRCTCGLQISKDAKAGQPVSTPTADSSTGADSGAAPRSPRSPRSPQFRQASIPEVATLLEFVAWVVFCEVPASARSANWFKGRGGYLADQLDAVRDASIRVQARLLHPDDTLHLSCTQLQQCDLCCSFLAEETACIAST